MHNEYNKKMKRKCFYMAEIQIEQMDKLSKETGFSTSELLRQAISLFLEKKYASSRKNN